jgi:DNA polymerase (family 10)
MDNLTLARHLREHARRLDAEGGNLYRVRAYRRAADVISTLAVAAEALLDRGGRAALQALPGVGAHIALTVESLLRTGAAQPVQAA